MANKLGAIFLFLALTTMLALRADDESGGDLVLKVMDHAKLLHKMKTLVIDQIDWKNLSVQDAVKSLAAATKRCDPQHEGINFVLTRTDLPQRITLKLRNASVREIIEDMGLAYFVERFAISLFYDNGEGLCSSTYLVSSKFFQTGPDNVLDKKMGTYEVRKQLETKGIHFPPGTLAIYTPATKTLRVVNTYQEVLAVDDLLNP